MSFFKVLNKVIILRTDVDNWPNTFIQKHKIIDINNNINKENNSYYVRITRAGLLEQCRDGDVGRPLPAGAQCLTSWQITTIPRDPARAHLVEKDLTQFHVHAAIQGWRQFQAPHQNTQLLLLMHSCIIVVLKKIFVCLYLLETFMVVFKIVAFYR